MFKKMFQTPPIRSNLYVGAGNSMLNIPVVCLRLNLQHRLDLEPDGRP
jgi:hypothetical protein